MERTVAESKEGFIGLRNLALLQEPTRGFGTEEDSEDEGDCWDESGGKLETPSDGASIDKSVVFVSDISWPGRMMPSELLGICNNRTREMGGTYTRLAQVPRKIPNAVQTCQLITKPPRMLVGAISAE